MNLRIAIVVIAVISAPLSQLVRVWNRGGFAFQQRHAQLASAYLVLGCLHERGERVLQKHVVAGHSCGQCRQSARPASDLLSEARRKKDQYFHDAWLHQLVAGPVRQLA